MVGAKQQVALDELLGRSPRVKWMQAESAFQHHVLDRAVRCQIQMTRALSKLTPFSELRLYPSKTGCWFFSLGEASRTRDERGKYGTE